MSADIHLLSATVIASLLMVLFLIHMESAANWLGEKALKFLYKQPRSKFREIVVRAGEFYISTWYLIFLTGAVMAVSLIIAAVHARWGFAGPLAVFFAILGAAEMIVGLYLRKRKIGMRWSYYFICMLIREIRRGERESFAPLQGPGFWESDEVHRAFARDLARAKKKFGVTDEEWERWRKDYEEYLKEDIFRVQILSVQDEFVLLKIFSFPFRSPSKNRYRDIELMCKLADLPASVSIETDRWFDARIRIEDNAITKWVSWEVNKPWPTDEEMEEMMRFFS